MLIVALVMAVVGLAALVTAIITSNELIAWVCIAASVIGVLLLIIDALRSRSQTDEGDGPKGEDHVEAAAGTDVVYDEDYPEEAPVAAGHEDATAFTPTEDAGEPAGNDGTKS